MKLQNLSILYCEDDIEVREAFTSILLECFKDANLTICSNGLQGQIKFAESKFDLIISDNDMGEDGADGISLYNKVRETNQNILFVLCSGREKDHFRYQIERDKRFLYLSKGSLIFDELKKIKDLI